MKTQTGLKILLVVAALFSLSACGKKSSGGSGFADSASNSADSSGGSTALSYAVCSKDMSGLSDFQVRLEQYVDNYGQAQGNLVRLQVYKAPSAWSSANWDLQVYRWTASPDGSTSIDSSPLAYQFDRKVSGGFQNMANINYTIFNWDEIVQMGAYAGISTSSPQSYFNTATLVVDIRDSSASYQVLQVVLRNNGTVVKKVDVLIPQFLADPALYNADNKHPAILQALHPLKDQVNQGWSQANYAEFAKSFCF